MGLTEDIRQDFLNQITTPGGDPPDSAAQQKIQELSEGLSTAIVDWIQAQTFEVTEFKAPITIDTIQTTGDIPSNIPVETQMGPYSPLLKFLQKIVEAIPPFTTII